jgi:hypothetical protein
MAKKQNNTKRLAVCAMLSAMGVILLYIGSVVEVMDISLAVIASLTCVFAVIEYGGSAPWLVFAVTSVLSVILLPQKAPAVMYVLFFGFYPILKERFEKMRPAVCWALKEAVFNASLILIVISLRFLLFAGVDIPLMMYVIAVAVCEVIFLLYDFALTRLISLYVYKLRKRLRIK